MNRHNGHGGNFSDSDNGRDFDRGQGSASRRRSATGTRAQAPDGPVDEKAARPSFSVDPWSLLRPAAKRWYWLLFAAVLCAIGGAVLGLALWKTHYSATAQLVRYDPPVTTDAYRPAQLAGPTLVGMLEAPDIMKKISERMQAAGGRLEGTVKPVPTRQSDILTVNATGKDPRSAINLANFYNEEVIRFTQEQQRKDAEQADTYVTSDLNTVEAELTELRKAAPSAASFLPSLPGADGMVSPNTMSATALAKLTERIEAARDELSAATAQFTDIHPKVKAARAKLAELEAQLQTKLNLSNAPSDGSGAATSLNNKLGTNAPLTREEQELLYFKLREKENYRNLLVNRQRAIQVFKNSPPGNFKIFQPATVDTVSVHKPYVKVAILSIFLGVLGMVAAAGELLRRELFDTRLKTEADVARVTGLPVLAHLGDIRQMSLATREAWAFRAWIALQDRLAYSPNHGLICGITSSNSGDGRSTWINLLAGAARKCGFRVLTIATRPTADAPVMTEETTEPVAEAAPQPVAVEPEPAMAEATAEPVRAQARATTREPVATAAGRANGYEDRPLDAVSAKAERGANGANGAGGPARPTGLNDRVNNASVLSNPADFAPSSKTFAGESEFTALTASALFTPAMVTEKLMGTESDPLVHIPLPGWTWNLERRKQWQGALNVWRKIDNVVILVELPPASMPESVLLASNLPNLLWLAEAGKSDAADTRAQLQTLRHARCNLVGAVVNRALAPVANGKFARWVGCLTLFASLGLMGNDLVAAEAVLAAATPAPAVSQQPGAATFSATASGQRAQWQQKLTLGPGDVLNLSLYGDPLLTREEVPIGPDGRVSYLEAENVMAAGLTVDEFRDKLNEELGKFRRAPQAFVVPVSFKSKKYYVLGRVANRGAFPLDRPMTLLEAVARAGGMETGLTSDRNLVELADLSRSFIARNNQRLPVDFEKLFAQGDLSQNVSIEPGDYIYFPGSGEKEVYVLGAVRQPGSYLYTSQIGAMGAISARGGFSERAWMKKVVVIRGGLGRPQVIEIDAKDVLSAAKPDVKLQPKDIVFVSERPWIRAEELLDAAANAFVTSAVVTFTSEKITRDPR